MNHGLVARDVTSVTSPQETTGVTPAQLKALRFEAARLQGVWAAGCWDRDTTVIITVQDRDTV